MDAAQLWTLILGSSVVGGIATKTLDWIRDARAGHLERRRAEVDKAIGERDKARAERDAAVIDLAAERAARDADVRWWERWARILEEALALARRRFIDAPGTDPDELDPYPSRPSRDKP
ncbi:hypothetical protein NS220_02020 [Microbacterium testaceum]|uniref:Uncharacterized protein n=1 Tax=Microbacterium testaceum TaxID=2033 RepID=A0A147F0U5_MICTE|nr:hypothetical protein [Microbacterium testaceum]KTR96474.1 hypothetical protein NS220_02020 [Microbacterium testaceum]